MPLKSLVSNKAKHSRFHNSYQKGYIGAMKYYNNIPKSIKAVTEFRVKVLEHKNQYGIESAINAFGVSRSTIYNWQQAYRKSLHNSQSLIPKSTRPKHLRRSKLDYRIIDEIARLRNSGSYGCLGKSKLKVFLDQFCLENNLPLISESSIGRCLKYLKAKGSIAQYQRLSYHARIDKFKVLNSKYQPKLRRDGYYPKKAGELVQMDCVIKFHKGIRKYIVSAIDYKMSFAYSFAYEKLDSSTTSDFIDKLVMVAPFNITHIQTDNGTEFHQHFDIKLRTLGITHFWNYVGKPIYNGKIERYNRTIQEDFIDPHITTLFKDIDQFNHQLTEWLIFYNTKRPHFAHRSKENKNIQIPPLKAYINMLNLTVEKSNMLWTHTYP